MRARPDSWPRLRPDEIACGAGLVLAVAGIVMAVGTVGWTAWTIVCTIVMLAGVVVIAASVRHRKSRPAAVPLAVLVVLAVVTTTTWLTTWHDTTAQQRTHDRDIQAVAQRATEIAELLTTVAPESRADTTARLQPLVIDGMADLIEAEVLYRIPADTRQHGVVHAVGVQDLIAGSAHVITVVGQDPQPPSRDERDADNPSDLLLSMALVRHNGQWKLATVAVATA